MLESSYFCLFWFKTTMNIIFKFIINPSKTNFPKQFQSFSSIRKTCLLPTHIINNTTLIILNIVILLVNMLTPPPFNFPYRFLNDFDCSSFWVHSFQIHPIVQSSISNKYPFPISINSMHTSLLLDGQHFNVVSSMLLTYPFRHHHDGYNHHCHHQDGYIIIIVIIRMAITFIVIIRMVIIITIRLRWGYFAWEKTLMICLPHSDRLTC